MTLNADHDPDRHHDPFLRGHRERNHDVVVKVYKGSTPKVRRSITEEAPVVWQMGPRDLRDAPGRRHYTASRQRKRLGNGHGKSRRSNFMVITSRPRCPSNAIESPSKDTTPSFSGTASETEPVTVEVFEGPKAEGTPLQTVQAKVTSGKWGPVNSPAP